MNTEIDSKIEELKDMERYGTLPDLSIIGGEEKSEITVCRTDAAGRRREKR